MNEQQAITEMFDDISSHYDFLDHLLSFRIDKIWRRKVSHRVALQHPNAILDVATGTADLAIRMAQDMPEAQLTGIDLSEKMMEQGRAKIHEKGLDHRIHLEKASALEIPFHDNSFDAVTAAFGVRNFADLEAGLREMARVCRHEGLIAILEFSHPRNPLVALPYRWYSRAILPRLGRLISKHPTAYHYLPTSAAAFPSGEAFEAILKQIGLINTGRVVFSGGIATLYYGFTMKNNAASQ